MLHVVVTFILQLNSRGGLLSSSTYPWGFSFTIKSLVKKPLSGVSYLSSMYKYLGFYGVEGSFSIPSARRF